MNENIKWINGNADSPHTGWITITPTPALGAPNERLSEIYEDENG